METKSRYEVISDMEAQKRTLIREKNGFPDAIAAKEKFVKELQRQLDDTTVILKRKIEDAQTDLELFKKTLEERKTTVEEQIKCIDESLARFNKMDK